MATPNEILTEISGTDVWVDIKGFQVHVFETDKGIICDIWRGGEALDIDDCPIQSTYAFSSEL